jgi:hypothetical protein
MIYINFSKNFKRIDGVVFVAPKTTFFLILINNPIKNHIIIIHGTSLSSVFASEIIVK